MEVKLHEPTFGEEEIAAAVEVMRSTNVTSGERVRAFEMMFAYSRRNVMVNSGSSANLLAVSALCNPMMMDRLQPGDEVIVSALSWSTTVWPLVQNGLIPVIVDIDPETLNIDPEQVERAMGPRTRGIMPVHVYGNPCDMGALWERDCGWIIEDCCEALGAEWQGEPVGNVGHVGTFSFYFSHHITTMEGGMCMTEDGEIAEMMRILRAHGWTRDLDDDSRYREAYPHIDPRFLFVNAGYNLRPTEVSAAIGIVQLEKLPGFVAKRRAAAAYLKDALAVYGQELRLQQETPGGKSSWFGFPIVVKDEAAFGAAELRGYLEENGIETRPLICGNIARQPGMRLWPHRVVGDLPHADKVMADGFSIPCHQDVGAEQLLHISAAFAKFFS